MKKNFALAFIISLFFIGCVDQSKQQNTQIENPIEVDTIPVEVDTIPVEIESPYSWSYSDKIDRMSSETSYYASALSTNVIDFEFPYHGGTMFILTIRKNNSGTDVYLTCKEKCQFLSHYDDKNIKVKFDEEKPVTYSFSEAADGSSDIIFIDSPKKFIKKLKTSKKLLLGVEFYQAGTQYIDFEVKDLKWDR